MLQKIDKWSKAELFENSKETVLKNEMEESKKEYLHFQCCAWKERYVQQAAVETQQ